MDRGGLETKNVTPEDIRTYGKPETAGGAKYGALKSGSSTLPPESGEGSLPLEDIVTAAPPSPPSPANCLPTSTGPMGTTQADPAGSLPASVGPGGKQAAQADPAGSLQGRSDLPPKEEPPAAAQPPASLPPEIAAVLARLSDSERAALLHWLGGQAKRPEGESRP